MWDIFNKEKVEALNGEVLRLKNVLDKKNTELHFLERKLSELKEENSALTEQSEKYKQGIDAVLKEFREFLIHNREKGLNYDNLDTTRNIVDSVEDLNEYVLTLTLEFRNTSVRAFRKRFYHYITTDPVINSYRFDVDHVIKNSHRTETYNAILYIFTHCSFTKIENELLNFFHNKEVQIKEYDTHKNKMLTINGYFRDTIY